MKCAHLPALFALIFSTSTMAAPCNPEQMLSTLLGVRTHTQEWFAKNFQYHSVKNFQADTYFQAFNEFEAARLAGTTPEKPFISEFEKNIAWFDAQTATSEALHGKLPTLNEILTTGTESQKRKLTQWYDHYGSSKLTDYQIKKAATDLSLILHNLHYSLHELESIGAEGLAQKMVSSQYHQTLLEKSLATTLKENGLWKKENVLNVLNRWRKTSPMKWVIAGSTNTYTISKATEIGNLLIVSLPDHQIAKLTLDDLTTLLESGGVNSPKFTEIASQYESKVVRQVLYNSIQDISTVVSRGLWIHFGIKKIHEFKDYWNGLDQKHRS